MYGICEHKHAVASWAAATAARASKTYRFTVEEGRTWLEKGLNLGYRGNACRNLLEGPEKLPKPEDFDCWHREVCGKIQSAARPRRKNLTRGVAAKLLSVYLKLTFVCGGDHEHPRVQVIHPPVDRLLLRGLAVCQETRGVAGWTAVPWSQLNDKQYENLIDCFRTVLKGKPLWAIEEYWPGHQ